MDPTLEWRKIGETKYFVSENGNVYSSGQKPTVITSRNRSKFDYVTLDINGVRTSRKVTNLVATAFVENPLNAKYVISIDGNSLNIHYSNLRWSTHRGGESHDDQIWIPLKGHEDTHEISLIGVRRKGGLLLKPSDKEYPEITFKYTVDRVEKTYHGAMHRLMAIHFISNPNNLPVVNHKDGNNRNWKVDNLEWMTSSENTKHAYKIGLMSRKNQKGEVLPDKEGEIWKMVNTEDDDFNAKYEVSNLGNVRKFDTKVHLIASPIKEGYLKVNLRRNVDGTGKSFGFQVSRLVAFAFLEFTNRNDQVNHINKIVSDNRFSNLEILDVKEHNTNDHGHPVIAIHPDDLSILIYKSIRDASRQTKVSRGSLALSLRDSKYRCGGYHWFKLDNPEVSTFLSAMRLQVFTDPVKREISIIPL